MTAKDQQQPIEILLAEDNPGDVRLIREAFKRGAARIHLNVAANGEEALQFLRRQGKYAAVARPDLILLDLNLPGKDGRTVLAEIKNDPELERIPVIVLTSSSAEEDVVGSYKLRANCYICKPYEASQFNEVILSIQRFWLKVASLPQDCARF